MLRNLVVGAPVMVLCLVLQAGVVTMCLRRYVRYKSRPDYRSTSLQDIVLLSSVMMVLTLGNLFQVLVWGTLFLFLGEFDQPMTALYFSAVNFSTLGYGDIVMTERWRLLGPLEAANGILMFGVSTATMTAAVIDVIKENTAQLRAGREKP